MENMDNKKIVDMKKARTPFKETKVGQFIERNKLAIGVIVGTLLGTAVGCYVEVKLTKDGSNVEDSENCCDAPFDAVIE